MKAILELHYLQNFAPSNLNRDDTGSPKDAFFGGTRRLRISSQSFKRAMRQDFAARDILEAEELGLRSKRLLFSEDPKERGLVNRLTQGHSPLDMEEARFRAEFALLMNGIAFVEVKDEEDNYVLDDTKSEALAFLGEYNLALLEKFLKSDSEEIQKASSVMREAREKLRRSKGYKGKIGETAAKEKLRKAIATALGNKKKELDNILDTKKAVDVALFGRMLADLPDKNADAAAQVAHPISTHALRERQYDFYTAVDDLKPTDNAGADMLGTVEFASATVYRYACIDLQKLLDNLQGDRELLEKGLRAFLYASIYAAPTGKQNTFAAHNLPALMVQVVRKDASPRNLANAFEKGVQAERGGGYLEPSAKALADEMKWQNGVFGDAGSSRFIARDGKHEVFGQEMESAAALIDATVAEAMQALEG
ncbi:type I-E CRISPR-associated protein Cas7/Cse4/CasC [Deinococcus lacus]|uniref:Type I-E CRISPR-associated protein Cas7/Cse4/CasC n=1 Tax=Deinococcus lacus TaxID=392561 RepID=A0ABW1YHU9_9DEIO